MKKQLYLIRLCSEPEGGYTVTVPALPGCVTWGETYEHALEMAREAIEGYLETLMQLGKPLPPPDSDEPVELFIQVNAPVEV